jgi:hypothetical protein
MPKYIVKSHITHNHTRYPENSVIELEAEEAAPLLRLQVIASFADSAPSKQPAVNQGASPAPKPDVNQASAGSASPSNGKAAAGKKTSKGSKAPAAPPKGKPGRPNKGAQKPAAEAGDAHAPGVDPKEPDAQPDATAKEGKEVVEG